MGRLYTVFGGKGLPSGIECFGDVFGGDTPIPVGEYNEVDFYLNYSKGSVGAGTMAMRVYWSCGGSTYYQPALLTDANPTVVDSTKMMYWTLDKGASYSLIIPVPARGTLCRVSLNMTDANSLTCSVNLPLVTQLNAGHAAAALTAGLGQYPVLGGEDWARLGGRRQSHWSPHALVRRGATTSDAQAPIATLTERPPGRRR